MDPTRNKPLDWREVALLFLMLAPLATLLLTVPPIPQDPNYHALADARAMAGVPNFLNVVSNAAFLMAGAVGLALCLGRGVAGASRAWTMFFFGTFMVAFGSAYYHWSPDNQTLVWDRLPMTMAFMALFAGLLAEHLRPRLERPLLAIALIVGVGSVAWWVYSDDLRVYAWVQFAPLIAIVFVLLLHPARYTHRSYLVYGLISYAAAKIFEFGDHAVFAVTSGAVSGHTLKHLTAALAPLFVYRMLRVRKPVAAPRP